MKKTVCELFAGVGGFRVGLNHVKLENEKVSEDNTWDFVYANQWEPSTKTQAAYDCYIERFGESENHTNIDIHKVEKENIPDFNLLVGGFPCFIKDTMITTIDGFKKIQDVKKGDLVLTKSNNYYPVLKTMKRDYEGKGNFIKTSKSKVTCTENHPFYIMHEDKTKEWVEAKDIKTTDYCLIKESPSKDEWVKIEENKQVNLQCPVYNLEVEKEHNYIANRILVHICQDYSVARTTSGEKGIEGKKGVLWWDIKDTIEAKKPPFILLENVDRLLRSPASQRGRDFAVMVRTLYDNGYGMQWRVINAGEYGFPQKRRRVFIFAYYKNTNYYKNITKKSASDITFKTGLFAKKFPIKDKSLEKGKKRITKKEYKDLVDVSDNFQFHFYNTGLMHKGTIYTYKVEADYKGELYTLDKILQTNVDEKYILEGEKLEKFKYLKGSKKLKRKRPDGTSYNYTEGAVPFPERTDVPARTILTSEGNVSRTSHAIRDPETKKYRTLTPIECERIQMFPDNWTKIKSKSMTERRRYFMMGNALVTGIVNVLGEELEEIFEKE